MGKKKAAEAGRQYWLLKTEPSEWSWTDQATSAGNGTGLWDGVKNKQVQKNMKSMFPGISAFSPTRGPAQAVEVRAVGEMKERLADRKAEFGLLRQLRLSVDPVKGGGYAGDGGDDVA